jgi:hypothetical protein
VPCGKMHEPVIRTAEHARSIKRSGAAKKNLGGP